MLDEKKIKKIRDYADTVAEDEIVKDAADIASKVFRDSLSDFSASQLAEVVHTFNTFISSLIVANAEKAIIDYLSGDNVTAGKRAYLSDVLTNASDSFSLVARDFLDQHVKETGGEVPSEPVSA